MIASNVGVHAELILWGKCKKLTGFIDSQTTSYIHCKDNVEVCMIHIAVLITETIHQV